jgi:hypothetical protein
MMDTKLANTYLNARRLVDVVMDDASGAAVHRGYIIGASKKVLMIQSVEELSDDGIVAFPIARINKIARDEIHDDIEKILQTLGFSIRVVPTWISFESMREVLYSAMRRCVLTKLFDDDDFEIGLIRMIVDDHLELQAVDGGGNVLLGHVSYGLSEILGIEMDGIYARALERYLLKTGDMTGLSSFTPN